MKGVQLMETFNLNAIEEAVISLEKMLVPSLTERNVNLIQYASKLSKYGKVWYHYDIGKPISIITGYFNDIETQTAYLSMIAVVKEYQGKRLASSLLCEFEDYVIKKNMYYIKLEVRKKIMLHKIYIKNLAM